MERLGKYKIDSELGRGGMGVVYKAHDTIIGRDVAIKVIHESAVSTPSAIDRFRREARSAGRLSHDNIMTLYDFDESEGRPYLVMELLDGTDLRSLIQANKLTFRQKIDILVQIASGLEYAHDNKVVHRDIKPGNIQVTESGRVKILDFGIARLDSDPGTMTHSSLGTPRYMSPEQIKGDPVDRRSDIFSFGALAYEVIAERVPFKGDTATSVMYNVIHEEPAELHLTPDHIGSELNRIIAECLAKDIETRAPNLEGILTRLRLLLLDRAIDRVKEASEASTLLPGSGKAPAKSPEPAPAAAAKPPAGNAEANAGSTVAFFGDAAVEEAASPKPGDAPSPSPPRNQAQAAAATSAAPSLGPIRPPADSVSRASASPKNVVIWSLAGLGALVAIILFVTRPWSGSDQPTSDRTEVPEAPAFSTELQRAQTLAQDSRNSWGSFDTKPTSAAATLFEQAEAKLAEGQEDEAIALFSHAAASWARGAAEHSRGSIDPTELLACAASTWEDAESSREAGENLLGEGEFIAARASFADAFDDYIRARDLQGDEAGLVAMRQETQELVSSIQDRIDEGWKLEGAPETSWDDGSSAYERAERLAEDCEVAEAMAGFERARLDLAAVEKALTRGSEPSVADRNDGRNETTGKKDQATRREPDPSEGRSTDSFSNPGTSPTQNRDSADKSVTSPPRDTSPPRTQTETKKTETVTPALPLRQKVETRFQGVGASLCDAMENGRWSSVPQAVRSKYEPFFRALTEDHIIRDARVRQEILRETGDSIEQWVRLTVVQQQKGRDTTNEPLDIPMVWIWTLDGGEPIVSAVETAR